MWPFSRNEGRTAEVLIRNGLWFVDIPRTGSTSIKTILGREFGPGYGKSFDRESGCKQATHFLDHTSARKVVASIGEKAWGALYTFSFVRNPWERFHSGFKYRIAKQELNADTSFKEYVRGLATPRHRQKTSPYYYHSYHMSMCDYLMDAQNRILVKDVFKYEEREQALETLREKTGINFSTEWRESTKDFSDYLAYYDDESAAIIGQYFADDIQQFNYSIGKE
jgi:hypothetical protein